MSLYNALFGVNPLSGICLTALGITTSDVPRFRDAWLTEDGKIALHTRTGGGNRDMYEHEERARRNYPEYFEGENQPTGPWNADLRKLPGFEYDEDDDFDSTYATFYFTPQSEWVGLFRTLQETSSAGAPASDRWASLLRDLEGNGGPQTDAGKRALEVGKSIFASLTSFEKEQTNERA